MLVALIRVLIDVPEVSFLRLAQLLMQWMEPNKWGQWGDAILEASHVHCSQCMNRTIAWHIYRFMLNKQHMKSTLVAATAAVSAVLLLFSAQLLFACPEQSEAKLSQHWLGFYLCAFLQPSQRTQAAKFPSCPAAQKAPGLLPMHTAVSTNNNNNSSSHFGRLPAEGKCVNNKNA